MTYVDLSLKWRGIDANVEMNLQGHGVDAISNIDCGGAPAAEANSSSVLRCRNYVNKNRSFEEQARRRRLCNTHPRGWVHWRCDEETVGSTFRSKVRCLLWCPEFSSAPLHEHSKHDRQRRGKVHTGIRPTALQHLLQEMYHFFLLPAVSRGPLDLLTLTIFMNSRNNRLRAAIMSTTAASAGRRRGTTPRTRMQSWTAHMGEASYLPREG